MPLPRCPAYRALGLQGMIYPLVSATPRSLWLQWSVLCVPATAAHIYETLTIPLFRVLLPLVHIYCEHTMYLHTYIYTSKVIWRHAVRTSDFPRTHTRYYCIASAGVCTYSIRSYRISFMDWFAYVGTAVLGYLALCLGECKGNIREEPSGCNFDGANNKTGTAFELPDGNEYEKGPPLI